MKIHRTSEMNTLMKKNVVKRKQFYYDHWSKEKGIEQRKLERIKKRMKVERKRNKKESTKKLKGLNFPDEILNLP